MIFLEPSDCLELLRGSVVGRLAVVTDDTPDIFPVNYLIDHGAVVFRTAAGTKLDAAVGHWVAFEIDGYDADSGEAWSVVVKGRAHELKQLHEVLETFDMPLFPWHASPKPRFVRIDPNSITGRRFHVAESAKDPHPTSRRTSASPE